LLLASIIRLIRYSKEKQPELIRYGEAVTGGRKRNHFMTAEHWTDEEVAKRRRAIYYKYATPNWYIRFSESATPGWSTGAGPIHNRRAAAIKKRR
jgi:hypothetical protein